MNTIKVTLISRMRRGQKVQVFGSDGLPKAGKEWWLPPSGNREQYEKEVEIELADDEAAGDVVFLNGHPESIQFYFGSAELQLKMKIRQDIPYFCTNKGEVMFWKVSLLNTPLALATAVLIGARLYRVPLTPRRWWYVGYMYYREHYIRHTKGGVLEIVERNKPMKRNKFFPFREYEVLPSTVAAALKEAAKKEEKKP